MLRCTSSSSSLVVDYALKKATWFSRKHQDSDYLHAQKRGQIEFSRNPKNVKTSEQFCCTHSSRYSSSRWYLPLLYSAREANRRRP